MSRTPQTIQARLSHLLKHWPADPIRPSQVSVQTYLKSRLSQSEQSDQSTTNTLSDSSLNALSSLLEDRYARRYPLPPKLRHPASNPDHYDDLILEFEEAPSRDFLGRFWANLKGKFRFQ
ncbi:hypothetical protein BJX61DRAFT_300415 [Aspergillus egyptiacus]|nr:hypothetical protein BJX61DRAFT_300415 [Aspergillus egyptiacus]